MGLCWRCLFGCGYCLYARTCCGRCVHNCMLRSFKKSNGEDAVHTAVTPFVFNDDLMVMPLPFLVNNYTYIVADLRTDDFVFVDVGDASRLIKIGIAPKAILTTHRHWDHSGGNRAMKKAFPGLPVYGGEKDRVPDATHTVKDGEVIKFGRLHFTAILTPGHTRGHIVYRLHGAPFDTVDSVFTGDHLMLACCGATFEGSRRTMIESLNIMWSLPDDTLVWPGHEIGFSAIETAIYVQPENIAALTKFLYIITRRADELGTCPSTIGEEKAYNPFLRTAQPDLHDALGIRKTFDEDPMFKDQPMKIQEYTFEAILQRSEGLYKLKAEIKKRQIKERQEREKEEKEGALTDAGKTKEERRAETVQELATAHAAVNNAKGPTVFMASPRLKPDKNIHSNPMASVTSGTPGSTPMGRRKDKPPPSPAR